MTFKWKSWIESSVLNYPVSWTSTLATKVGSMVVNRTAWLSLLLPLRYDQGLNSGSLWRQCSDSEQDWLMSKVLTKCTKKWKMQPLAQGNAWTHPKYQNCEEKEKLLYFNRHEDRKALMWLQAAARRQDSASRSLSRPCYCKAAILHVGTLLMNLFHLPDGKRHCPNFRWGFPASPESCR